MELSCRAEAEPTPSGTTALHMKDVPSSVCEFIQKWQIPCPFWSTCFSEPLQERVAIAGGHSCPYLCRPSPIKLCSSLPFSPGSGSHLALRQGIHLTGNLNFQPGEADEQVGGESTAGGEMLQAQAERRQPAWVQSFHI